MHDFSQIRGEWFREKVEELRKSGVTQKEIAEKMGVKPQYLTPLLNTDSGRNASEKFVLEFCEKFEINQNDLLKRMRAYEFKDQSNQTVNEPNKSLVAQSDRKKGAPLIPVGAIAGLAKGDVTVMDSDLTNWYVIQEFDLRGVEFYIRVSGDSMVPKYNNGDLLACRRIVDKSFIQPGKIYVLDTDQGPLVKRLYNSQKGSVWYECRSDNTFYQPFDIPTTSIRSMAIVLGSICMD